MTSRPADGALGAAAVVHALDTNLSNDEQFAAACGLDVDDPAEFSRTIAADARPVGGDRIQPTRPT